MTNSNVTNSERSTIIARFVIVYIICIFFAIIPLYYLFNIPDKTLAELNVSKLSAKGQREQLNNIMVIYDSLDKSLSEKNLRTGYFFSKLSFAYDSLNKENLYTPLYLKISDLYQRINKINESDLKMKYARLQADSVNSSTIIQQLRQELQSCNDFKNAILLRGK